jgi:hypothetical protein
MRLTKERDPKGSRLGPGLCKEWGQLRPRANSISNLLSLRWARLAYHHVGICKPSNAVHAVRFFATEFADPTLVLGPRNCILPSMGSPEPGLDLLRKIIPPFLDVAGFYCSKDARAMEARRLVNEQHGREKAFHSTVWSEMRLLFETLVSLVPLVNQQEVVSARIHDLLNVLEDDFLRVTEPESLEYVGSKRCQLFV